MSISELFDQYEAILSVIDKDKWAICVIVSERKIVITKREAI